MQGSREIVQSERRRGGSKTNGKLNQPNDREYSAELGQLLNVLVQYRNGISRRDCRIPGRAPSARWRTS